METEFGAWVMEAVLALEKSSLGFAMRASPVLYPLMNVAHILGLGLLVGPILMLDLRLLGLTRRLPLRLVAQHILPWSIVGLVVLMASGFLLFIAEGTAYAVNPVFQFKMVLVFAGIANAVLFEFYALRNWRDWENNAVPAFPKLLAATSVLIWPLVAISGRLIAYF